MVEVDLNYYYMLYMNNITDFLIALGAVIGVVVVVAVVMSGVFRSA